MRRSALKVPRSIGVLASVLLVWSAFAAAGASAAIDVPARVADIRTGPGGSTATDGVAFGRTIIFRANNQEAGGEPWVSDGTAAGTVPLEVVPGPTSTTAGAFTDIGDEVVFLAFEASGGDELWRTDGTQAGTRRVLDINPGADRLGAARVRRHR